MHAYGEKLQFWDLFGLLEDEEAGEAGDLELIRRENDFSSRFITGFGVGGY